MQHFYSIEQNDGGGEEKHVAHLALGEDTFTAGADSAWEAKKKAAAKALMETSYRFKKTPTKLEEFSSKGETHSPSRFSSSVRGESKYRVHPWMRRAFLPPKVTVHLLREKEISIVSMIRGFQGKSWGASLTWM